mmetsp:Transcript_2794/g.7748  ORF Transcript_2794/g.7748 Transcript_2794/m.7748 type:complete len:341 (-) Transcript_2794:58-1080(-)
MTASTMPWFRHGQPGGWVPSPTRRCRWLYSSSTSALRWLSRRCSSGSMSLFIAALWAWASSSTSSQLSFSALSQQCAEGSSRCTRWCMNRNGSPKCLACATTSRPASVLGSMQRLLKARRASAAVIRARGCSAVHCLAITSQSSMSSSEGQPQAVSDVAAACFRSRQKRATITPKLYTSAAAPYTTLPVTSGARYFLVPTLFLSVRSPEERTLTDRPKSMSLAVLRSVVIITLRLFTSRCMIPTPCKYVRARLTSAMARSKSIILTWCGSRRLNPRGSITANRRPCLSWKHPKICTMFGCCRPLSMLTSSCSARTAAGFSGAASFTATGAPIQCVRYTRP